MKRKIKLYIIYINIIILLSILLIPQSISGFYQSMVLSTIYNANLFNNPANIDPSSLIGYVIEMRTLYIITDLNVNSIVKILSCILFPIIFVCYLLLFGTCKQNSGALTTEFVYPLVLVGSTSVLMGYVLSFSLPLAIVCIYLIVSNYGAKLSIQHLLILLCCWSALGLYWHSIHVMIFIFFVYAFIFIYANVKVSTGLKNNIFTPHLLVVITTIFVSTWFYVRNSVVATNLMNAVSNFNLFTIFQSKPTVNHIAYISIYSNALVDYSRYFVYLIIYMVLIFLFIDFVYKIIKKINIRKIHIFLIILFFSDITFQIIYYLATYTIGPVFLILFVLPFLLLWLLDHDDLKVNLKNYKIFLAVLILLMLTPSLITGMLSYYHESPEKNIPSNIFYNSHEWIENHGVRNIVSDAHTNGQYLLFDSDASEGQHNYIQLNKKIYNSILNESITTSSNVIAYNYVIYKNHYRFLSLETWTVYEPIEIRSMSSIELNLIYNDNNILLYK